MRRFSKGDRVKFKQGDLSVEQEGSIIDTLDVDHNPTYLVDMNNGKEPVYIQDVAPNRIRLAD